jgi:hypothetical protein
MGTGASAFCAPDDPRSIFAVMQADASGTRRLAAYAREPAPAAPHIVRLGLTRRPCGWDRRNFIQLLRDAQ